MPERTVARRLRIAGAAAVLALASGMATAQQDGVTVSGSARSLVLASRTLGGEAYTLGLNRLRLELAGALATGIALDLQLDQELLLASYVGTAEFRAAKDVPPPQYWRLEANTIERGELYGRQRLHRAAVTLSRGAVDLKLGRQRIAWGTGRLWSPLDILNPVSPLAIEREQRLGVDAVLLDAKLGPVSRLSLLYAPSPDRGPASRALQAHGNAGGVDGSFVIGRLAGLDVIGVDLAGQLGPTGVRAEWARLEDARSRRFARAMLGLDHAFANGLTLSAELFYNGAGERDPSRYDRAAAMTGNGSGSLATRYAGLILSYEITPLLKSVTYAATNLDDRSRALDSRLVWSWRPNVELSAGLQRFGGPRRTEYGRLPEAAFVQGQWFF
jgi:hypothetical protein